MRTDRPASPPRRFRRLTRRTVLGATVPVADRPLSRLLGLALLGPDRAGEGLLLPRCRAIHTIGMRFPLDVVFLDDGGRELRRHSGIGPWRAVRERRARSVLEIPSAGPQPGRGGRR
jgi:uncharacterized protein